MSVGTFNIKELSLDFFKSRKSTVLSYLFLTLAYPVNNIAVPHYYGKITELISEKGDMKGIVLQTLMVWVVAAMGIKSLSRIDNSIIPDFRSYIYTNIAQYIFTIHKENYGNIQIGELISKMSKIPYLVLEVFYQTRTSYLPTIYTIIFCLIYFLSIDRRIGCLVAVFIAVLLYVGYLSIVNCMDTCVRSESANDASNENLQDLLENILSVFTSDNLEEELKMFKEKDKEGQEHFRKCLGCSSKYKFIFSILYIISFLSISVFIYKLYIKGDINFSQVSAVLLVLLYLLSQVDSSMQYMQDTISYIGGIVDVQQYIDKLNIEYKKSQTHIQSLNSMNKEITNYEGVVVGKISLQNINLYYGDKYVLKDFSEEIPAKTKVAMVGRVGSGKSSILKMILKLIYPNSGMVLIDDKNLSYDVIRRNTSYITQTPILFNRSLYENIAYGTKKSKEDVLALLKEYNLTTVFGNHGLDSIVGRNGNNLSGGQKQIVMILRATMRNTPIILLDEPTTALDENMKELVMELILRVFRECTVIMITHDESIVGKFDRIIKLSA